MIRESRLTQVGGEAPTNSAAAVIEASLPYLATAKIRGVADILFHRWNPEAVDEKAKAAKGSKAKKTDDIDSFVYRNDDRELCIPGEYFRRAIVSAAKFKQDPRSPRKSAMDLFNAAVVSLTGLATLGVDRWDYEDRRRAVVQRNGVNRTRPAMKAGWECEIELLCNLPEYVAPDMLHEVLCNAGRLIGVGDFRPSYGRFSVTRWSVRQ